MKKKWIFLTGMLTGILIMIVLFVANRYLPELVQRYEETETMQVNRDSIRLAAIEDMQRNEELQYLAQNVTFDEKSVKVFQVIQSINNDQALVYGQDEYGHYLGTLYLLKNDLPTALYDDQIINIPKGKLLRLIGTYQYVTRDGVYKTVPKVIITNKDI